MEERTSVRAKVAKCGAHRTGAAQGFVGKEHWDTIPRAVGGRWGAFNQGATGPGFFLRRSFCSVKSRK